MNVNELETGNFYRLETTIPILRGKTHLALFVGMADGVFPVFDVAGVDYQIPYETITRCELFRKA